MKHAEKVPKYEKEKERANELYRKTETEEIDEFVFNVEIFLRR